MNVKHILNYKSLIGLSIFTSINSFAASAVAVNKTTGSYGYAYGKKTEADAKAAAIANCPGGGEIVASSPKDGHGAVLRSVNNWKTDGKTVTVKGILAQADPVGIRKPGTGDCPDCYYLEIWYDNASSSDKEKFEGAGGKKGPEDLKQEATVSRNGEIIDVKIIDGREFRNGFGIAYVKPDLKTVMRNKSEYYMGLSDGVAYAYNYVEGQEPIISREAYYKDGWKTGLNRSFGVTGAVLIYEEFKKGIRDGFTYTYNQKGQLQKKGYYKNNQQHGLWQVYSSSTGLLSEKGSYEFGSKEGEWTFYEADGKTVKKKKNFVKGLEMK